MSTSTDPDEIRADIERTRAELSADVDALEDKVSPSAVLHRRTDRLRSSVQSVRERVMGTAHDAGHHTASGAHHAGSSVRSAASGAVGTVGEKVGAVGEKMGEAPTAIRRQTEGNPLAAGVIAFGVGWLAGSLIPASQTEQRAAAAVKEKAKPLVDEAKDVASQVAGELKPAAQEAMQTVKDRATDAAASLKDEGRSEVEGLKAEASDAAATVKEQASESASAVKEQASESASTVKELASESASTDPGRDIGYPPPPTPQY